MKTVIKKVNIFLIVIYLTLIFSFQCCCINKNKNYEFLFENGYTSDYLDRLSDKTLENIVSSIGDNNIFNVKCKTEICPDNSNLVIKSMVAKIRDKQTDSIVGESICICWEWLNKKPLIREEDYLSVKWNKDLFVYEPDSFYAEDHYKENNANTWTVSDTYSELAHLTLNSLGHWTKPKMSENIVGGSIIFNLSAKYPINTTDYSNNLNLKYAHKYELIKTIFLTIILLLAISAATFTIIFKRRKRTNP